MRAAGVNKTRLSVGVIIHQQKADFFSRVFDLAVDISCSLFFSVGLALRFFLLKTCGGFPFLKSYKLLTNFQESNSATMFVNIHVLA